ncbi:FAD-dependent oxidoreductase [Nocardia arthritidis]|uniref:ferredoxin--NADP(+) reductase n=1 Tax=Nocardia arthritidis TaxID=228602 RepID=A0A6G9YH16_9NOCA|nr:FAD-dependent oxidoreductase [Nocardia arthritidis]QIS12502.1 4Fe-4S ferredoxin [Nocardia arthritidis]
MPHVVTQPCCSDGSCVYVCPVNCIHPTPDEPDFLSAEMLYIDPGSCIDCGTCMSACPVDAIVSDRDLTTAQRPFIDINAAFYREPRPRPRLAPLIPLPAMNTGGERVRVAIVGSGPAAMYAADELLSQREVRVNIFDRCTVPYGLVQNGVAPDQREVKEIRHLFDKVSARSRLNMYLGVEIGTDVTHEELLAYHHAVIYAVGASASKRLGIPGEDLPGCESGIDFAAWYNGHPDYARSSCQLSTRRAVIIGNGNVALDAARILTLDRDQLDDSDIAPAALSALRHSKIQEVIIVGRRGPAESAFTVPEFVGLLGRDIDIVVDAELPDPHSYPYATEQKLLLLQRAQQRTGGHRKRIVFRYQLSPTRIYGKDRVTGVSLVHNEIRRSGGREQVVPTDRSERLSCGLILTAIGNRGVGVAGLPFDEHTGVIPNIDGRVLAADSRSTLPGVYVTGWIKRGSVGFIGTNRSCAQETVRKVAEDVNSGLLRRRTLTRRDLEQMLSRRKPTTLRGALHRS